MDYLWTPWRYQYVTSADKAPVCVFCEAPKMADREALIVRRVERNYIILNRYPYTSGHLMIVPYRHAASLDELGDETLVEMIRLARDAERRLREVYSPEGLNFGINLGKSAGAGIAGHVHLHGMPRWTGDTSFITTVGETRVLPEALEVTWDRLRAAFEKE